MKKVIISILLVLPFILIYLISFTGQILSKYTYIPVERIEILNQDGDEIPDQEIKCELNENFQLRIKVFPEYASNKRYKIVNSNSNICEITEDEIVRPKAFGQSTIYITSDDKKNVQRIFTFSVTQKEITDINILLNETILTNNQEVPMLVGRETVFVANVVPTGTIYRDVVWSSSDNSVAEIEDSRSGKVIAKSVGTATITVASTRNPNIKKSIVIVVSGSIERGVKFSGEGVQKLHVTNLAEFDLKSITEFINVPSTISVEYTITNYNENKFDISKLSEGKIIFKTQTIVEVKLTATDGTDSWTDIARIRYKVS